MKKMIKYHKKRYIMNKLFKTLILILYTSAIFIVALLIIKSTNKGANFEKYTSKSYDDNIAVVTQVIEKRSSKEETDTDYEKSEYDIHLFIKKLSSVDVKNLYAYFAIQTAEGVRYVQSTSGKAMEDTSSVISTIKISNSSSNKFAVNEVVVDEEHDEIIYMNRIPDKIYVFLLQSDQPHRVLPQLLLAGARRCPRKGDQLRFCQCGG